MSPCAWNYAKTHQFNEFSLCWIMEIEETSQEMLYFIYKGDLCYAHSPPHHHVDRSISRHLSHEVETHHYGLFRIMRVGL